MVKLMTPPQEKRNPFEQKWYVSGLWVLIIVYLIYSVHAMDLSWIRFSNGLGHADTLFDRMFPPNFSRWELLLEG